MTTGTAYHVGLTGDRKSRLKRWEELKTRTLAKIGGSTYQELATILGVSTRSVHNYMSDLVAPTTKTLNKIEEWLNA